MPNIKVQSNAKSEEVTEEVVYNVYYNTVKASCMVTTAGRTIYFVDGKYVTNQQEEIDYLEAEMSLGNTRVFTIKGEERMTSKELDPMAVLKAAHFKEFKAQEAERIANMKKGLPINASTSAAQKLTPASTASLGDTKAKSDSVA